jgi:hypothetical protein
LGFFTNFISIWLEKQLFWKLKNGWFFIRFITKDTEFPLPRPNLVSLAFLVIKTFGKT